MPISGMGDGGCRRFLVGTHQMGRRLTIRNDVRSLSHPVARHQNGGRDHLRLAATMRQMQLKPRSTLRNHHNSCGGPSLTTGANRSGFCRLDSRLSSAATVTKQPRRQQQRHRQNQHRTEPYKPHHQDDRSQIPKDFISTVIDHTQRRSRPEEQNLLASMKIVSGQFPCTC